jgi:hypothetical protein
MVESILKEELLMRALCVSEKFVPHVLTGDQMKIGMWLLMNCVNNHCKKQTKYQFSIYDTNTSPWKKMLHVTKSQNFMLIISFVWHPDWLGVHSRQKNNSAFYFPYGGPEVLRDAWLLPSCSATVLVKNQILTIPIYHIFQIFLSTSGSLQDATVGWNVITVLSYKKVNRTWEQVS